MLMTALTHSFKLVQGLLCHAWWLRADGRASGITAGRFLENHSSEQLIQTTALSNGCREESKNIHTHVRTNFYMHHHSYTQNLDTYIRYVHTYIHINQDTYMHTYIHTYIHTNTHTHTCIHRYTHADAHVRTNIIHHAFKPTYTLIQVRFHSV